MKNALSNPEEILNQAVSGFHRYVLSEPRHLCYVSRNLCDMTGYTEAELLSERDDRYAALVHPADAALYAEFIHRASGKLQTHHAQYRLLRKDGSVLYVDDTMTSRKTAEGSLVGDSVLTDITALQQENDELRFLSETIPCGFIKYSCEKQPKITYINKQMMELLRFPPVQEGELDYRELYADNIFLMIPMEERSRFARYLNRVDTGGAPLAGEMSLLRCDGTRMYIFGWVTKCINEQGVEEYQSVCMDITERHRAKQADETQRYLKALTDVYDKIFEYDLSTSSVKCLYSDNSPTFKWLENISMQMEDATERWITGRVTESDRSKVRSFFQAFMQKALYRSGEKPPQISYQAESHSGEVKSYSGIFLKMDEEKSLYCCRPLSDDNEADNLRSENASLKENMQELLIRFTDGIAAFEVVNNNVTPLYASDNVCEFFGLTKSEWLPLMEQSTPLDEFVARSDVAYEDFAELLRNGEREFVYFDLKTETERRIKAICSQKAPSGSTPRYVMLYNVAEPEASGEAEDDGSPVVSIRTFGYFDVFVGKKAISFRNKKSKELFALLVDRRGGFISSEEAIGFLWEDEPVSPVTLARYRKVALRLKNILEEYGISDVIEVVDGKRRIVMEKVRCDLYDYLSGDEAYAQLFKGSYLNNYSWGETTLAELTGDLLLD